MSTLAGASIEPSMPTFWTDEIEGWWRANRTRTLAAWGRSGLVPRRLLRRVAEAAVALGFGSRRADPQSPVWSIDLEARLREEWGRIGYAPGTPWERISVAARYGWENSHATVWPVGQGAR